jgi:hypothetical protein
MACTQPWFLMAFPALQDEGRLGELHSIAQEARGRGNRRAAQGDKGLLLAAGGGSSRAATPEPSSLTAPAEEGLPAGGWGRHGWLLLCPSL